MNRISCTGFVLLVCLSLSALAVDFNEDSKVKDENAKPTETHERENETTSDEKKTDYVSSEPSTDDTPSNLKARNLDLSMSMGSMEDEGLMNRGLFGFGGRGRRRGRHSSMFPSMFGGRSPYGMGMGMDGMGMGGMSEMSGMGRMGGYGRYPSRYGGGYGSRYRMGGGYGRYSPYGMGEEPGMMGMGMLAR